MIVRFATLGAVGAILVLSTHGAMAQSAAMSALTACKPDIKQFCSTVQPGNGRIKACMKQHIQRLSEPCKEALFHAWLSK